MAVAPDTAPALGPPTIYHCAATKAWVVRQLREHGPQTVFGSPQGVTLSDALQILHDDPREFFTLADCDNTDDTGRCRGHRQAGTA